MTEHITVAEDDDVSLPLLEVLTGRGFITGKSGSGKSNSASVIVEEILEAGHPLLIIDTDGEYWGLKDTYEVLHLGAGEMADVPVTMDDAGTIVELVLEDEVPTILDVSGFLREEDAKNLINQVVRELFRREKRTRKPMLLVVEEVHEYIPEGGGLDDAGETLIQVAKRGRKHGLGLCGVSQRPASVDKDFITQCDWIVWHRLTWKNDTKVVRKILGSDAAEDVQHQDAGEALLMTDWDETLESVQFRKKTTFDAGATPGMDEFEVPGLVPVSADILDRLGHDVDPEADADARADRYGGTQGTLDDVEDDEPTDDEVSASPDEPESPGDVQDDDPGEQPNESAGVSDQSPDSALETVTREVTEDRPTTATEDALPTSDDGRAEEDRPVRAPEVVEVDRPDRRLDTSRADDGAPSRGRRSSRRRRGGAGRRRGGSTTPEEPAVVEFGALMIHVARRTADRAARLVVAAVAVFARWIERVLAAVRRDEGSMTDADVRDFAVATGVALAIALSVAIVLSMVL